MQVHCRVEPYIGQAADFTSRQEWGFYREEQMKDSDSGSCWDGEKKQRWKVKKEEKQTVCLLLTECQL